MAPLSGNASTLRFRQGVRKPIRHPQYFQGSDKKIAASDFCDVQFVNDPESAVNAHSGGAEDLAYKVVAGQAHADLLAVCCDKGRAIVGRTAAVSML